MFGLNSAEIIGRLGADVEIRHLTTTGKPVANLSVATDESYINRDTGEKIERVEWHRIVTFQEGLINMLQEHAKKGRLVFIKGKLQTRRWRKPGEETDRFSTEIHVAPGDRIQFLDSSPNSNSGPKPVDTALTNPKESGTTESHSAPEKQESAEAEQPAKQEGTQVPF